MLESNLHLDFGRVLYYRYTNVALKIGGSVSNRTIYLKGYLVYSQATTISPHSHILLYNVWAYTGGLRHSVGI